MYYHNTAIAMLIVTIVAVAIYAAPFAMISLVWLVPLFLLFRLVWTTFLTTHSMDKGKEQYFTHPLYEKTPEPKELLEIPPARHAGGFFQDRQGYSEHVVAFFNRWLT